MYELHELACRFMCGWYSPNMHGLIDLIWLVILTSRMLSSHFVRSSPVKSSKELSSIYLVQGLVWNSANTKRNKACALPLRTLESDRGIVIRDDNNVITTILDTCYRPEVSALILATTQPSISLRKTEILRRISFPKFLPNLYGTNSSKHDWYPCT